jgi:Phosphotransferase enzyme family
MALVALRGVPTSADDEVKVVMHRLLVAMIECLPPSLKAVSESRETFVLAHLDLSLQNILVQEDGTVTGIIDWDNVHTVPRCVGYARYPSWITRDWDPVLHGYGDPNARFENSPEELERYRQHYSSAMRAFRPEKCLDYTTKSHLHEAVSIAAYEPICTPEILRKIFEYVFPDGLEDGEYPLDYYDTLYALADEEFEDGTSKRMYEAFRNAFSIENIVAE